MLREHISQFALERVAIRKKSTVFRFLDNLFILTGAEHLVVWIGLEAQLLRLLLCLSVCLCVMVWFVLVCFGFKRNQLHLTFL